MRSYFYLNNKNAHGSCDKSPPSIYPLYHFDNFLRYSFTGLALCLLIKSFPAVLLFKEKSERT